MPRPALLRLLALLTTAAVCGAQQPKTTAYPERDILSPFRQPADVYAPPDELFRLLRRMQAIAEAPGAKTDFDARGRELVDDDAWRADLDAVQKLGVDAAYLAQIMRLHKNAGERATAFYGAFFCDNVDHVMNLIAHIPGEPERRTRERAMPRAIAYLHAHLGKRFGDLGDDAKKAIVAAMPEPGSPAAKAKGITRLPRDEDQLFSLRLVPFFQLLDLDEPLDQAQGLWFLKEVFLLRLDLALQWLEPSLPRLYQLLASDDVDVRDQAVGLFAAIGPKDLPPAPLDDAAALRAWAERASRTLFPPIRNLNDAVVQLHPSRERETLAQAARTALASSSIGDAFAGKDKDGRHYLGFRVATVPDDLKPLAIPAGAVITTVNGVGVTDAKTLLATVEKLLDRPLPCRLIVEYRLRDEEHAVEYRVL